MRPPKLEKVFRLNVFWVSIFYPYLGSTLHATHSLDWPTVLQKRKRNIPQIHVIDITLYFMSCTKVYYIETLKAYFCLGSPLSTATQFNPVNDEDPHTRHLQRLDRVLRAALNLQHQRQRLSRFTSRLPAARCVHSSSLHHMNGASIHLQTSHSSSTI